MNSSSRVKIPPQVLAHQVGEETVILDLESGHYFGLDPVGARIWQSMSEGQTLGEVCEGLLAEFEVTADVLERDVLNLAGALAEQHLITFE